MYIEPVATPTAPVLAADLCSTLAGMDRVLEAKAKAEPAPYIPACLVIADELRGTELGATLLRPNLRNLAPLDALRYEEKRADLRERGLLDDENKLTRRGRVVQGCL
jgi:hypothetical protein